MSIGHPSFFHYLSRILMIFYNRKAMRKLKLIVTLLSLGLISIQAQINNGVMRFDEQRSV
jgi:hypothetical protein